MAVAVVVNEGAAGSPAGRFAGDAGFLADVSERAVSIIVIKNILAVISDEQVVEAVVVVVANADALSPAGTAQPGFIGDVGEGAITIVFEKVRGGFLAFGKTFKTRAIHDENIEPAVV